jgi:hypothetical protein
MAAMSRESKCGRLGFAHIYAGATDVLDLGVNRNSSTTMTHLLPPNLLKLFAPRPPLPFVRSVGKDPDKVRAKNVSGVAALLAQIREENESGIVGAGTSTTEREEGEAEKYTYAEEIKRGIYREQRQKRKRDEFQKAKETCKQSVCRFVLVLMGCR